jgi:hypothetical protein
LLKCPLYPPNASKESSTTTTLKPCHHHDKNMTFLRMKFCIPPNYYKKKCNFMASRNLPRTETSVVTDWRCSAVVDY